MEAITERGRRELYEKAEASWGKRAADVLMALLPPVGWADVATKADIAATQADIAASETRLRGEIAEVRGEIAQLRGEMKIENARLLRTMVVVNFTTATALCVLTFQIAQAAGG